MFLSRFCPPTDGCQDKQKKTLNSSNVVTPKQPRVGVEICKHQIDTIYILWNMRVGTSKSFKSIVVMQEIAALPIWEKFASQILASPINRFHVHTGTRVTCRMLTNQVINVGAGKIRARCRTDQRWHHFAASQHLFKNVKLNLPMHYHSCMAISQSLYDKGERRRGEMTKHDSKQVRFFVYESLKLGRQRSLNELAKATFTQLIYSVCLFFRRWRPNFT